MATIIQDPQKRSPYWIAVFTVSEAGRSRRIWRTTKIAVLPLPGRDHHPNGKLKTKRELRAEAEEVGRAIEKAERAKRDGSATEVMLKRLLSGVLERVEGRSLTTHTVESWLAEWIAAREPAVSKRTIKKYKQAREEFLLALGRRRRARLDSIQRSDFVSLQTKLLEEGLTPQTINGRIRKVLAGPFRLAWTQGLLPANPLAGLPPLRTVEAERGTFTIEEIQRLTAVASPDWQGVILTGFYTGARLLDVSNLRWENVDLSARVIKFTAAKTGRAVRAVIHPCLADFLLSRPTTDDPKAFLFPTLALKSGGGRSGLSMSFRRIMDRAEVAAGVAREAKGLAGRNLSSRSFHSLRHSFNSALANSGVSQELRRKLTGHSSDAMNSVYTHLETETLRNAVELLPRIEV